MSRNSDRRSSIAVQAGIFLAAMILCGATMFASSSSSSSASSPPSSAAAQPVSSSPDQICTSSGEAASCAPILPAGADPTELRMWQLINQDRSSVSCVDETKGRSRPLQWDVRLAAVAREHSQEMASIGFFGHQGADGSFPDVRISRVGLRWRASGENIAKYPDIAAAEAAFMNEPKFQPNHRANILNPDYTHVGVGVVRGADGMFYITQEFAQLR
jgi:uncharacterized protein YkwD